MTKPKNKVAYQVNDNDEGCSVVVFHNHALAARRIGSERLGEDFDSVTSFRVSHFDKFADQGFVPVMARLEAGWWFICPHCSKRVTEDESDLSLVVCEDDNAFCDQVCFDSYKSAIVKHNTNFESLVVKVQELRPDLQFSKFTGLWPQLTFEAKFNFDGCQYGGSVRKDHRDDGFEWYVSNGDKEAWDAYELNRSKKQPA